MGRSGTAVGVASLLALVLGSSPARAGNTEHPRTPVLWPDFRRRHLLQAIFDYQKRERRYGGINPA